MKRRSLTGSILALACLYAVATTQAGEPVKPGSKADRPPRKVVVGTVHLRALWQVPGIGGTAEGPEQTRRRDGRGRREGLSGTRPRPGRPARDMRDRQPGAGVSKSDRPARTSAGDLRCAWLARHKTYLVVLLSSTWLEQGLLRVRSIPTPRSCWIVTGRWPGSIARPHPVVLVGRDDLEGMGSRRVASSPSSECGLREARAFRSAGT